MPVNSHSPQKIADQMPNLVPFARAIHKAIEGAKEESEMNRVLAKIQQVFSGINKTVDLTDFCTQIIIISQVVECWILQMGVSDDSREQRAPQLHFQNFAQLFSRIPDINYEITKFRAFLESHFFPWGLVAGSGFEREDIITQCYEAFLGAYDKAVRDSLGTFYTPTSAVDFIVRSVDYLLRTKFDGKGGLKEAGFPILDPASGTNIFLTRALRFILQEQRLRGEIEFEFPKIFLKNYESREIHPATYALGAFNVLSVLSTEWRDQTFGELPWNCKLSDTLELLGKDLDEIKKKEPGKQPPLIVWGNPPYKKDAKADSPELDEAMRRYRNPVRFEKSLRVLSDYYVKFLRYAHERVLKAGQGIVALVLNSSYIDGPIHRGLRSSLIADFSDIFVLNLHGAIQPPEITPSGVNDQNIFGIRTGVSILFLIKNSKDVSPCQEIHYWDCWGIRIEKLEFLRKNSINSIKWSTLPTNRFGIAYNQFCLAAVPASLVERYVKGISIRNIFKVMVMGVTTGKDQALTDFTREGLVQKILENRHSLQLPASATEASIREQILPYNYRPLDYRYIFYAKGIINRDRRVVMKYLAGGERIPGNVALVTERFIRAAKAPYWNFIYASEILLDKSCISNQDNSHVYPLFCGNTKSNQENIRKEVVVYLSKEYAIDVTSSQVFDYILGLLSTPKFQAIFSPLLGLDYPVIIFPKNGFAFTKIAELGSQMKKFFLKAEKSPVDYFHSTSGTNSLAYTISDVRLDPEAHRLWYAPNEYIEIRSRVGDWFIGYFHPIEHYFSDRMGRVLTSEEVGDLNRTIWNLQEIIHVSQSLDATYELIGEFLDCGQLLKSIIQGELNHHHKVPIPGVSPSAGDIMRIQKTLYLPDKRFIDPAQEEKK